MRHLLAAVFLLLAPLLNAQDVRHGPLIIENAHSLATPATAAAAYFTITNTGEAADRLRSVRAPFGNAMLHESRTDADGVMRMTHLMEGIALPPGETVTLARGGLHVMLTGLEAPLQDGESFPLTLDFEQAGSVEVTVAVQTP